MQSSEEFKLGSPPLERETKKKLAFQSSLSSAFCFSLPDLPVNRAYPTRPAFASHHNKQISLRCITLSLSEVT